MVCLGQIFRPAVPTPLQTAVLCSDLHLGECLSGFDDLHLALLVFFLFFLETKLTPR